MRYLSVNWFNVMFFQCMWFLRAENTYAALVSMAQVLGRIIPCSKSERFIAIVRKCPDKRSDE